MFETTGEGWVAKAREVIEARITTYPSGSVSGSLTPTLSTRSTRRIVQLHFNLLAIRDDPMPSLQAKMDEAVRKGQSAYASSLLQQISTENEKREQWNVSIVTFALFNSDVRF